MIFLSTVMDEERLTLTRHRRCLCLGGMLCIHACLTKYTELKYTSSNESLLLLVEHDLELII